jgi:hypothetical protein
MAYPASSQLWKAETGFMVKPWLEKAITNSKNHHLYRIIIATLSQYEIKATQF